MRRSFLIRTLGCLAMATGIIFIQKAEAQCSNDQPYQTVSYSSYAIGNGNQTVTIPQFDPSAGTLYSVSFSANIYFNYDYVLVNTSSNVQDKEYNVRRRDLLAATSPMNPTPIQLLSTGWYEKNFQYDELFGTGVPPGSTSYSNKVYSPKVVSTMFDQNIVSFMGGDSLYLKYTTVTQDATGYGSTLVNMTSKTVYDSILFNITYNYCPTAILPSTLIHLNSARQSSSSDVLLSWISEDKYTDGWYELLKSTDGKTYTSVNRQPIDKNRPGAYNFLYKPEQTDGSKGFFRVRQTGKNGNIIYSSVVTVALPKAGTTMENNHADQLLVYPTNPSSAVTIVLPEGDKKDEWQISIISLAGQALQQSTVKDVTQVQVELRNNLSAGLYIVNAYNKRTNRSYKGKIIIQR